MMKYLYQAGIVFLFTFLGEVCAKIIPIPMPAAIWGLLLLFAALCAKLIRVEKIKECSGFLVALMPVLFVAPTVNLMEQAEAMRDNLPAVIVIIVASTVLTILVTGRVVQRVRRQGKGEEDHD